MPPEHCLAPELDPEWATAYQMERRRLGALNPRLLLAPVEELRAQGHYSAPASSPLWRRLALHRPIEVPTCPVAPEVVARTEAMLGELVITADGEATAPAYPLPAGGSHVVSGSGRLAGGPRAAEATPLERQMHAELEDSWHVHHSTPGADSVRPGVIAILAASSVREAAHYLVNAYKWQVQCVVVPWCLRSSAPSHCMHAALAAVRPSAAWRLSCPLLPIAVGCAWRSKHWHRQRAGPVTVSTVSAPVCSTSCPPSAPSTAQDDVKLQRQLAEEYLRTHIASVPDAVGWPGLAFRLQRTAGLAPEHAPLDLLRLALPAGRELALQFNPFLSAASAERLQQGARVWLQVRRRPGPRLGNQTRVLPRSAPHSAVYSI